MQGKSTPANKAGKTAADNKAANKTAANTNAANNVETKADATTDVKADADAKPEGDKAPAPAPVKTEGIKAPAAPAAAPVFKISKKAMPKANGKRGGKGGNGGAYLLTKMKFAEAQYNHVDGFLKHILNGHYRPAYAHTSGFYATADGIGNTPEHAVPETVTARYDNLEAAIAAGDYFFSSVKGESKITYVQNKKLTDYGYAERTSKPSVAYHCFLLCDKPEDVAEAIEHLQAFEALNPNQAGMVKFLTDAEGNVVVSPVVTKAQPAATTIKPAASADAENNEAENNEAELQTA